jgi:F-type H+-transporting ATPase subunit gamma
MASLKDLRNRIKSVQSTRKITSAMKMISAAKLKRAQESVEASRPYTIYMGQMLSNLLSRLNERQRNHPLLQGKGHDKNQLIIVVTSNRGLCGSFNASLVRQVRTLVKENTAQGRTSSFICVGRKSHDQLKRDFQNQIREVFPAYPTPSSKEANEIVSFLLTDFQQGGFDQCTLVFSRFVNPLKQEVTVHRLIPFTTLADDFSLFRLPTGQDQKGEIVSPYTYEPSEEDILTALIERNLKMQVYRALLENAASEHGARMAAMDGATRNAQEMIKRLTLTYNRTRQASITRELIEIISGAEAL